MSNAIAAREQDKQGLTLPAAVPPLHAAGELGEGPHSTRAQEAHEKMKPNTEHNKIVAEGEATGHAHRIDNGHVEIIDGTHRRIVTDGAKITHEEHKPLTIPAGRHLTGVVREIDPLEDEIRGVRD